MPQHRAVTFGHAIALVLCLSACGEFDRQRYLPTSPDFLGALTVSSAQPSIPADGFSTTRLTATISADASATRRTIVFDATKGSFAGSGSPETGHIEAAVDDTGTVTVLLRSTTVVETAAVTVTVKDSETKAAVPGVAKQLSINFTPVRADDVLTFTAGSPSIPADGFSRTRLTATVATAGNPARNTVTFRASKGTLVASGKVNADASVDVTVDGNGLAVADLRSSSTVESAIVSATVGATTKTLTVAFTAPDPNSIVRISAASSSAPADGATRVPITATIAAELPGPRTVTFSVSGATFNGVSEVERQVAVDGSNRAVIDVVAPSAPVSARVRATINGVSADTVVSFVPALPQNIFVSPVAAAVGVNADDKINVSLLRDIGVASGGLIVTYAAKDALGNPTGGVFSAVTLSTSVNGSATVSSATYNHSGGTVGLVTIEVTAGGVIGRAQIRIQ
jgi:adhesin/invasin